MLSLTVPPLPVSVGPHSIPAESAFRMHDSSDATSGACRTAPVLRRAECQVEIDELVVDLVEFCGHITGIDRALPARHQLADAVRTIQVAGGHSAQPWLRPAGCDPVCLLRRDRLAVNATGGSPVPSSSTVKRMVSGPSVPL